jgi:hypothetical protein
LIGVVGILLELCVIHDRFMVWVIWLVIVALGIGSMTRRFSMTLRRGDPLFLLICFLIYPFTMF